MLLLALAMGVLPWLVALLVLAVVAVAEQGARAFQVGGRLVLLGCLPLAAAVATWPATAQARSPRSISASA